MRLQPIQSALGKNCATTHGWPGLDYRWGFRRFVDTWLLPPRAHPFSFTDFVALSVSGGVGPPEGFCIAKQTPICFSGGFP